MLKFHDLGKSLLMPATMLALVFVAAGSVVTVATTSTGTSTESVNGISAARDSRLEAFCRQYWGSVSPDGYLCRFDLTVHVNLSHVGRSLALSRIAVVPGDTVSVISANNPEVVVGSETYGNGSHGFVAGSSGYLSFRADPGQTVFSVLQVRIQRCFGVLEGKIDTLACPGH
ncbi:MAG TPA: hypothetical protein VIH99_06935 [Bdellovibrionota bacterium]|jgi:hypothetical protein